MSNRLSIKLTKLPKAPGVYFFKDARKKIIYVGKASVLKSRVRSYFQAATKLHAADAKTQVMIGEIADLDWTITDSEIDALFLESEMVKRYKPKYNIELQDDKHYLYVRIPMKETYPALTFVRRPLDDGANYYGPYVESFALRKALRYLRRVFPYSTHVVLPKRVCLQYHLGLCPGVEEAKISSADYKSILKKLALFLKGERVLLIKQLENEMRGLAKKQAFEQAAKLRNQIRSLKGLAHQIVFGDQERFDVTRDQALNGLAQLLGLKSLPRRIEAYDISHLAGTDNVASMIVFIDGVTAKSHYRKFKMQLRGNDDFAHMREVISRRFSSRNVESWPKPDLLVIDGGKGQLQAALDAMSQQGINIPAIGLAKRLETIITAESRSRKQAAGSRQDFENHNLDRINHEVGKFQEISLPTDSHVLKLLMRIRDESHRFAVTYHSLLRSKRQTVSQLDNVPGIGPATRKKLLKHFGSLSGIKKADQQALSRVLGTKKAILLRQYL